MEDFRVKEELRMTEYELEQIKAICAEEIAVFGMQFEEIQKIYDVLGLSYPEECTTNYRDSWFHYRKMYKKKDLASILDEKYGLEEHLFRATKDAQICLLQQLGYWLEVWYRYDEYMECDMSRKDEYEQLCNDLQKNWVKNIYELVEEDDVLFANTCLYRYLTRINSERIRQQLQRLIHSIKNLILEIRLGGVSISRPLSNVNYLNKCIAVYNEMCQALATTELLYLIPATGVIIEKCSKQKM